MIVRELTVAQARVAWRAIALVAIVDRRPLTRLEGETVEILKGIVGANKPPKLTVPEAPKKEPCTPPPVGAAVTFRTAGREGLSPFRPGTVLEHRKGRLGVWMVIREDGAAPGVVLCTRASLVRLAE